MATPRLGQGGFAALPILGSTVKTDEGSSGVCVALFGAEAGARRRAP
jgi:hypothetical protein